MQVNPLHVSSDFSMSILPPSLPQTENPDALIPSAPENLSSCDQDLSEMVLTTQESINYDKFLRALKAKIPNLEASKAQEIARKIIFIQKNHITQKVSLIPLDATAEFPYHIAITAKTFNIVHRKIGAGANSDVYPQTTFPTENFTFTGSNKPVTPSKPIRTVLKRSKLPGTRYSPHKREVDECIQKSAKRQRPLGVVRILETAKDQFGYGYSINKRCDDNALRLDYSKLTNPVKDALTILFGVGSGIQTFHDAGKSHKDIKGANILFVMDGTSAVKKGQLDDHEFVRTVPSKEHKTYASHLYLDPSMFEKGSENLIKQKKREGIQTLEGDVYAFGVTICNDFILKIIRSVERNRIDPNSETRTLLNQYIEEIKVKKTYGPFSEGSLRANASLGYQIIYHEPIKSTDREILLIQPSPTVLRLFLDSICNLIKDYLCSPSEYQALLDLVKLSCEMRDPDPSKRPTIHQVNERLELIIRTYESTGDRIPLASSSSSSLN